MTTEDHIPRYVEAEIPIQNLTHSVTHCPLGQRVKVYRTITAVRLFDRLGGRYPAFDLYPAGMTSREIDQRAMRDSSK